MADPSSRSSDPPTSARPSRAPLTCRRGDRSPGQRGRGGATLNTTGEREGSRGARRGARGRACGARGAPGADAGRDGAGDARGGEGREGVLVAVALVGVAVVVVGRQHLRRRAADYSVARRRPESVARARFAPAATSRRRRTPSPVAPERRSPRDRRPAGLRRVPRPTGGRGGKRAPRVGRAPGSRVRATSRGRRTPSPVAPRLAASEIVGRGAAGPRSSRFRRETGRFVASTTVVRPRSDFEKIPHDPRAGGSRPPPGRGAGTPSSRRSDWVQDRRTSTDLRFPRVLRQNAKPGSPAPRWCRS